MPSVRQITDKRAMYKRKEVKKGVGNGGIAELIEYLLTDSATRVSFPAFPEFFLRKFDATEVYFEY